MPIRNRNKVYTTLGATNHSLSERQKDDYYATDPRAAKLLLMEEDFSHDIWECACGEKHLSNVFSKHHKVRSSDIVNRCNNEIYDFLSADNTYWGGDIITNPPYKYAKEFIEKALSIIPEGNKVAMFLKIQFLEGKSRKKFFQKNPPCRIYVSSSRILCAKNGDFNSLKESGGSAICYAWYVWKKGYRGDPKLKWIN